MYLFGSFPQRTLYTCHTLCIAESTGNTKVKQSPQSHDRTESTGSLGMVETHREALGMWICHDAEEIRV